MVVVVVVVQLKESPACLVVVQFGQLWTWAFISLWGVDKAVRFVALCDMSTVGMLVHILQCTAKAERAERNYR